MKQIQLPTEIETVAQAIAFMDILIAEQLVYHPEDDAIDCLSGLISKAQARQINKLMDDIWELPGNEDRAVRATFDPCEYLLNKGL